MGSRSHTICVVAWSENETIGKQGMAILLWMNKGMGGHNHVLLYVVRGEVWEQNVAYGNCYSVVVCLLTFR